MDELRIPRFYILAQKLSETEQTYVHAALRITPCKCGIVTDCRDVYFVSAFCAHGIICADSEQNALSIATKFADADIRPILVIGTAEVLDAVYDDGARETLVAKAPDCLEIRPT